MWIYEIHPFFSAVLIIVFVEVISLSGLLLTRRFLLPKFIYGEAVNEAISGTVQAIGVFYGITVGLIAVGVWNTNTHAAELVSNESTAIATLYRDVSGYPSPLREELRADLNRYTVYIIDTAWPAQRQGKSLSGGVAMMDEFQEKLYKFAPTDPSQSALHQETLGAYNNLHQYRSLRIDAVSSGLSATMWAVIWVGAIISIGVAYLYRIDDARIHAILVALMGGFLAMVLFMIVINDRPFYGNGSISPAPYQRIMDRLMNGNN